MNGHRDITGLLQSWSAGDAHAGEALASIVYDELHRRAAQIFRSENAGHTLQPTALVNEAFVRLVDIEVEWQDRAHFYALCSRMIRRLLIDHANARRAQRRGGGAQHVTLGAAENASAAEDIELAALVDALESLETMDPDKARLIEMQYFGGLTVEEMSEVTGQAVATIGRHLRFARAWIKKEIMSAG